MINSRTLFVFLAFYLCFLFCLAPINLLSLDTYYYWEWSRHLALSYYDGSPLIAYVIKLFTLLFGNTLFALSSIGIVFTALTSTIIYKTARFFLTKEASCIAMLAWLLSPLTTIDLLKQTTYDTPLALFWALTLYFTVQFIQTHNNKKLYSIGASLGLMMLSKYTGIVLILGLLIFLASSTYRSIFKTKQFYLATVLALLIFSPVLVWNYQNHWISFTYQLTSHQLNPSVNPIYNMIKTIFVLFLPVLNFMLLPLLLIQTNKVSKEHRDIIKLLRTVSLAFLCFYLYTASHAGIRENWLAPFLIGVAPLFGYCYEQFNYRKMSHALILLYGLISLVILIDNTYLFNFTKSKKMISYHLMQQFNKSYPNLATPIFTSGWFEARMLFFLNNQQAVYTLGCGNEQNQYALWSAPMHQKINQKVLKEIVYIDKQDRAACLKHYFAKCSRIPTNSYHYRHKDYALHVYKCTSPIP